MAGPPMKVARAWLPSRMTSKSAEDYQHLSENQQLSDQRSSRPCFGPILRTRSQGKRNPLGPLSRHSRWSISASYTTLCLKSSAPFAPRIISKTLCNNNLATRGIGARVQEMDLGARKTGETLPEGTGGGSWRKSKPPTREGLAAALRFL